VDLLYDGDPLAVKPTIADVHTQPTDAEGDPVGRVLHVGTGFPRTMVVSVNAERTFVGLVYDYAEVTTDRFQRLSDSEWTETISNKNPDDVVWMRDVVVR